MNHEYEYYERLKFGFSLIKALLSQPRLTFLVSGNKGVYEEAI